MTNFSRFPPLFSSLFAHPDKPADTHHSRTFAMLRYPFRSSHRLRRGSLLPCSRPPVCFPNRQGFLETPSRDTTPPTRSAFKAAVTELNRPSLIGCTCGRSTRCRKGLTPRWTACSVDSDPRLPRCRVFDLPDRASATPPISDLVARTFLPQLSVSVLLNRPPCRKRFGYVQWPQMAGGRFQNAVAPEYARLVARQPGFSLHKGPSTKKPDHHRSSATCRAGFAHAPTLG